MQVAGGAWTRLLLLPCLLFFIYGGPYRAVRFSTTGDFATLYGATRCWLHGADPYSSPALKRELASAGAPRNLLEDQDVNPSVYSPASMPWTAGFASLRWPAANASWCAASLLLFAWSVFLLLKACEVSREVKWLAGCAILLFSPAYVGVYDGNPSVAAISLVTVSLCVEERRASLLSGLCLGIAGCFKPQLAVCAVCVFLFRRRPQPLWTAAAVALLASIVGVAVVSHGGRSWHWWDAEKHNLAASFSPGGTSDPTPHSPFAWQLINAQTIASYVAATPRTYNALVWLLGAALTVIVLVRRTGAEAATWTDAAFFSALTLTVTYHRYYDAQLLLLILPALIELWRARETAFVVAISACLAILAFPIQSAFAHYLGDGATLPSLEQLMLLRNQPLAVLVLACALAARPASKEISRHHAF